MTYTGNSPPLNRLAWINYDGYHHRSEPCANSSSPRGFSSLSRQAGYDGWMLRGKIVIVREKFSRKGCARIFQSSRERRKASHVDRWYVFILNPSTRSTINSWEINLEDGEHVLQSLTVSCIRERYLREIFPGLKLWPPRHVYAIFISRNVIIFRSLFNKILYIYTREN